VNLILALSYSVCTLIGLTVLYKYSRSNPVYWFLVFQWLMGSGIMMLIDVNLASDLFFVSAYFASTIAFLFGVLVYLSLNRVRNDYVTFFSREVELDSSANMSKVLLVFLLSALVTVAYYMTVGTNLFLNIVLGIAIDDFSTSRLAAYSSDTYFAPGYANQFKNVLLPLTTSILGAFYFFQDSRIKFKVVVVFAVFALPLALLGTGQRAFLAYSFAAFVFGIVCLSDIKIRNFIFPGIFTFSLFTFMTFLYKSDQMTGDENVIFASIGKTLKRFFYTEQEEVMITFRVLFERNIVYFYEWYEQLRGILPGDAGSYLQHEMFALRHGTDRGTAAISTVASVIYNGGLISVFVVYFLSGYSYFALYHRFLKGRRSIIRVLSYCSLFFYLATFVSGGPSSLINNGALAILIFIFIRKITIRFPRISKAERYGIST
jgi:oligosaccharide repeat unit polymerase